MEPLLTPNPAGDDMRARWVPTAQQRAVAQAMLTAAPDATHVMVGLALPGKARGLWEIGQPVEAAPGFWLATNSNRDTASHSYSHARNAADKAAGEQLGTREGSSSYATIARDGHVGVFEGIYGVEGETVSPRRPPTPGDGADVPTRAFAI